MATDERDETMDELSRYWNDLTAGRRPAAGEIDPQLAAVVRRLHATGRRGRPDPDFLARLEEDLIGASPRPSAGTAAVVPTLTANPNGRSGDPSSALPAPPAPPPLRLDRERRRWTLAQLATAALLLLTLVAGLLLLRVVRPGVAVVPVVEQLLVVTVEGPPSGSYPITVERWTFQPGGATLRLPSHNGPQVVAAEHGTFVAILDGVEQPLAPGTPVVVEAGRELVVRNAGAGEATLVRIEAATSFVLAEYDRRAISPRTALDTDSTEALPAGKSRVVFERLTLPPATALPPMLAQEKDWLGVVDGRLGVTLEDEQLPTGWRSGVERELGPADRMPRLVPGTRLLLRNIGEEPLVLLRLTVIPLTAGESPASAPEAVTTTG